MTGGFGERLTKSRIEQKPKAVLPWEQFFDNVGLKDHPEWQDDLDDLVDLIGKGEPIPARYYRATRGRDALLDLHGILHIHLESPASDVIVYLVQFEDEVLLLGVGSHAELARDALLTWRARGAFHTNADKRAVKRKQERMIAAREQIAARKTAISSSILKLQTSKIKRAKYPVFAAPTPQPPASGDDEK